LRISAAAIERFQHIDVTRNGIFAVAVDGSDYRRYTTVWENYRNCEMVFIKAEINRSMPFPFGVLFDHDAD
jgi:hypothetical protein